MNRLIFLVLSLIPLQTSFSQWLMINSPSNVNDLIISSSGKMLAATNTGLYISTDNGTTWDSTFNNLNINKIKKDNLGNIYFNSGELYKSSDDGINWLNCFNSNSDLLIVNFDISSNNDIVIAAKYWYNYILKSEDNGNNWDTLGTFASMQSVDRILGITQNSSNSIFFSSYYHTSGGIVIESKLLWRTTDNGAYWERINSGVYFNNIYFFQDTMYLAAENNGAYISPSGIYKSYNEGDTLIIINNGLINKNTKKIIITPGNILLCFTYDGIYRSLDAGNYWQKLNLIGLLGGIKSIYFSDEGVLYACTTNGIGVFSGELPVELTSFIASHSLNKVQINWQTATELNNQGFEIQRKFENSDWITIGFRTGKGTKTEPTSYFYEDDISELNFDKLYYRLKQIDFNGTFSYSAEVEVITQPLDFALYQNYPNPFNPSTIINFAVKDAGLVSLKVYDILGSEVATLVNETKVAGNFAVEFNAANLPSGVYIYTLQINGYTESKKMLLLK